MVLAMPVQGLAAAVMLHCAAGAAATQELAHQHLPHQAAAHRHDGMVGHDDAVPVPSGLQLATPAASGDSGSLATGGHTCSACAACCAPMALPAAAWDLPLSARSTAPLVEPGAAAASFIASGLERPPRLDHG